MDATSTVQISVNMHLGQQFSAGHSPCWISYWSSRNDIAVNTRMRTRAEVQRYIIYGMFWLIVVVLVLVLWIFVTDGKRRAGPDFAGACATPSTHSTRMDTDDSNPHGAPVFVLPPHLQQRMRSPVPMQHVTQPFIAPIVKEAATFRSSNLSQDELLRKYISRFPATDPLNPQGQGTLILVVHGSDPNNHKFEGVIRSTAAMFSTCAEMRFTKNGFHTKLMSVSIHKLRETLNELANCVREKGRYRSILFYVCAHGFIAYDGDFMLDIVSISLFQVCFALCEMTAPEGITIMFTEVCRKMKGYSVQPATAEQWFQNSPGVWITTCAHGETAMESTYNGIVLGIATSHLCAALNVGKPFSVETLTAVRDIVLRLNPNQHMSGFISNSIHQ